MGEIKTICRGIGSALPGIDACRDSLARRLEQRVVIRRVSHIGTVAYRGSQRILSVIGVERVHGVDDLGEIVFRLRLSGLVLNCFESGKEQADQNRNDRDDDEQLDESERAIACCWGAARGES